MLPLLLCERIISNEQLFTRNQAFFYQACFLRSANASPIIHFSSFPLLLFPTTALRQPAANGDGVRVPLGSPAFRLSALSDRENRTRQAVRGQSAQCDPVRRLLDLSGECPRSARLQQLSVSLYRFRCSRAYKVSAGGNGI